MKPIWIELPEEAHISVKNGLLVVDFTQATFANSHESVRYHYRADGALVLESEQQRWVDNLIYTSSGSDFGDVPLVDLHPSMYDQRISYTSYVGWWWNRQAVVKTHVAALWVRYSKNEHRRFISNHYAFIFEEHAD